MNMTQFLTAHATGKFHRLDTLARKARECGFLLPTEPQFKFATLLEQWMQKYPDGVMSNGMTYWCELWFAGCGQLRARSLHHGTVGLIRVGHPIP